jgi:hypothetical protein
MALANDAQPPATGPVVLPSGTFKYYIDSFNANDQELYPGYITNGGAVAIANIADLATQTVLAGQYRAKAAKLKQLVQEKLWDRNAEFFKVLPRNENRLVGVRELQGYTPWYFNLPDTDKSAAWKQLMDSKGFYAPFGPTTAEQRDPHFTIAYGGHECHPSGESSPSDADVKVTRDLIRGQKTIEIP